MVISIACGAVQGVEAFRVNLEVDFTRQGIPAFSLVGLAEGALREAKERVFAALRSSALRIPPGRITVNLAPADKKKTGSAFDLPLAIGLLAGSECIPATSIDGYFFLGELSLNGELRPVPGVLPVAILAHKHNTKGFIVPTANAQEAAVVEGLPVFSANSLAEVVAFLTGQASLPQCFGNTSQRLEEGRAWHIDFAEVKGQEHAKRAIEIAAAGAHNLLLMGPPGSGKSMLAQRLPTVLPDLTLAESLEVTSVYSVANLLDEGGLITQRPFRSPHHTISDLGLIGGGSIPRPGEISLAHRGVLFLDELPEFQKNALEVLRQPLEDGKVTIARAAMTLTFPANIMLVAAMNPCPCGYRTDTRHTCTCSSQAIQRYQSKLSGPLLDRIDLHIEVPAVPFEDLTNTQAGSSSGQMRERINMARDIQATRFKGTPFTTNTDLSGALLEKYCVLDATAQTFLKYAVESLALSARAYTRILRIARTVADLHQQEHITQIHLAEAINCRTLDRERI